MWKSCEWEEHRVRNGVELVDERVGPHPRPPDPDHVLRSLTQTHHLIHRHSHPHHPPPKSTPKEPAQPHISSCKSHSCLLRGEPNSSIGLRCGKVGGRVLTLILSWRSVSRLGGRLWGWRTVGTVQGTPDNKHNDRFQRKYQEGYIDNTDVRLAGDDRFEIESTGFLNTPNISSSSPSITNLPDHQSQSGLVEHWIRV